MKLYDAPDASHLFAVKLCIAEHGGLMLEVALGESLIGLTARRQGLDAHVDAQDRSPDRPADRLLMARQ